VFEWAGVVRGARLATKLEPPCVLAWGLPWAGDRLHTPLALLVPTLARWCFARCSQIPPGAWSTPSWYSSQRRICCTRAGCVSNLTAIAETVHLCVFLANKLINGTPPIHPRCCAWPSGSMVRRLGQHACSLRCQDMLHLVPCLFTNYLVAVQLRPAVSWTLNPHSRVGLAK
jgi:hypothetical protein